MRTVHAVPHPTAPVEVTLDSTFPDAPAVALEVGFPGKDWDDPVFIPVEIAREVAQAIFDALPN